MIQPFIFAIISNFVTFLSYSFRFLKQMELNNLFPITSLPRKNIIFKKLVEH